MRFIHRRIYLPVSLAGNNNLLIRKRISLHVRNCSMTMVIAFNDFLYQMSIIKMPEVKSKNYNWNGISVFQFLQTFCNEGNRFQYLFPGNDQRRGKADLITMGRFGQETVLF